MSDTRLLLRGGRLLSLDAATSDLDVGDVLIAKGRIHAIAPRIDADDCEVLDATGKIVAPGFVDTHRHVWQTQLRTTATDWSLFDYFVRMRSIYSALYTPDDVYLGNHIGALEALNAGITTIVDHCHIINSPEHGDEAVRGLRDAGIRGIFCYGLFANPTLPGFSPEKDSTWRATDFRRMRHTLFAAENSLLTLGLAPNEAEASPFELIRDEIRLGRELGASRMSLHVAMGAYDRGRHVVGWLAQQGLLGEDLLFVHGSALSDDELVSIADAGAAISATPETELQMGMGHPVTARALERGVRTSLGIDIVSNYSGDMFAQMRLQLQAERGVANARLAAPPRAIRPKAREVLELATRKGALALGLDNQVGSLAVGKQADVILVRTDSINMAPATDPVGALVLNANPNDVDTVLVGGRVVKSQGRLVGVDWPQHSTRLARSAERIHAGFADAPLETIEELAAKFML